MNMYTYTYKWVHDLLTNFSYLTNPIAFYNEITGLENERRTVDVAHLNFWHCLPEDPYKQTDEAGLVSRFWLG